MRQNSRLIYFVITILLVLFITRCGREVLIESPLGIPVNLTSVSPIPPSLNGHILFHSNNSGDFDIYVINANGTGMRRLTSTSGDDIEASWSPDGQKIAFTSQRDGNYEIYIMNTDGSEQQRLTRDPATDWGPTWSPDSKKIVFASDRNGQMNLFMMNADGSDQRPLLTNFGSKAWAPAWSPVGEEIAFVSDVDGDSELFLLQIESNTVLQLTFNERRDDRPSWSPDGSQIVYMGAKADTSLFDPDEIYIIPRLGGTPRQLTDNLIGDILPCWSPDGEWIAFSSSRNGGWNIMVIQVSNPSNEMMLTFNSAWNRDPSWGP